MRKELMPLPWLTAELALSALADITKLTITHDLLMQYCHFDLCDAYLFIDGTPGWCCEGTLPAAEGGWTTDCFAFGPQRLTDLSGLIDLSRDQLLLTGSVRTYRNPEAPVYENVEWITSSAPSPTLYFKRDDILKLAEKLTEDARANTDLDPRERTSVSQIIGVLASMAGVDISRPYALHEAMAKHAASAEIKFDVTDGTVAKFFKLAREDQNKP